MANASSPAASEAGPASDSAGRIESHGIDLIHDSERHGRAWELFPLWFSGNIIFTYLLFGGLLVELGLSLTTCVILTVVFNLAWIFVGLLATVGPKTGTATMVVSRVQYGYHGNKLSCLFNWVVQVGYEGVNFSIAALATYSLADDAGWHLNTAAKTAVVVLISGVSFIFGLYGHATIVAVQKGLSWALGIATLLFMIFLLPHVKWSYQPPTHLHGSALTAAVLVGITVVLSGPLSYPVSADYARYLPRATSSRAIALFTAAGGYLPTVVLTVTGVLAATAVDPTDFTTSIHGVVPGWFYPIFLLIVILGLMSNSIYSIYSSGLVLQTMGVPLKRTKAVWIDALVGTGIAIYGVIIASDFLNVLQNFLLWSVYWLAPFFGIYIAELLFQRDEYHPQALHQRFGKYWYRGGVRWGGVAALVLGMIVAVLFSNTPYLKGPLSTHLLDGGDLSAIAGFVVGGTAYWLLCVLPDRRNADPFPIAATAAPNSEVS